MDSAKRLKIVVETGMAHRHAGFTDKQWWSMCDANMSLPEPLGVANLLVPFVYSRDHGVFYVSKGHHQLAMSTLLAWRHGLDKFTQVAKLLNLRSTSEAADKWLEETPGAAFRSSVGDGRVKAGRCGALSAVELRRFGEVEYLFSW